MAVLVAAAVSACCVAVPVLAVDSSLPGSSPGSVRLPSCTLLQRQKGVQSGSVRRSTAEQQQASRQALTRVQRICKLTIGYGLQKSSPVMVVAHEQQQRASDAAGKAGGGGAGAASAPDPPLRA
mgnify:CR=1 FL=1